MIPPSLRLRRAILTPDCLLVQRILSSHPALLHNPDFSSFPPGLSNTSLHLSASLGHLSIVNLLLHLGHEDDGVSLNEDHQTPLMLAATNGHAEVVNAICEWDGGKASGVGRRDRWGRDAVMYASKGGWDTCLQILLTYAPPLPSSTSQSQNPNTNTSSNGEPETAASRLLQNADVKGNTALHFASSNGHLLVLRTLLAAGADAERRNVWSWTAISYSATVAAEVYFKGLVAEVERRKGVRREAESRGTGGGVRMVQDGESL
jgi:ankyrin repeat protein